MNTRELLAAIKFVVVVFLLFVVNIQLLQQIQAINFIYWRVVNVLNFVDGNNGHARRSQTQAARERVCNVEIADYFVAKKLEMIWSGYLLRVMLFHQVKNFKDVIRAIN